MPCDSGIVASTLASCFPDGTTEFFFSGDFQGGVSHRVFVSFLFPENLSDRGEFYLFFSWLQKKLLDLKN